ncbi:hypothetical protein FJZ28_00240 [Candidatus Peregrinibacteria bacterium]|nr:hypothetical protein [Candidatus Peregrinibacteria bacterium]
MSFSHQSLRNFAHQHDDIPAFHAGYLLLTILSAAMLNLGAFVLLIAAHMSLDFVKYRERNGLPWSQTFEGMLRESLVDLTLLFTGVALSVYLHHHVAVAALSGMFLEQVKLVRALALFVPKFEILRHFVVAVLSLRSYLSELHPGMHTGWSGPERLCMALCVLSIVLVAFASPLMSAPGDVVTAILADELIPWRL